MSMSTLECLADRRALDEMHTYQSATEAAEQHLSTSFLLAASLGDMGAVAQFAGKHRGQYQTVGAVLADAAGYVPESELMGLLCAVARGEDQQEQAKELLRQMAEAWASQNVEVAL